MYYGVGGTFDQCPLRYVFAFVFVCNLRWVWFLTSSLLPSFVVLDKFNACDDFNIFSLSIPTFFLIVEAKVVS